MDEDVTSVHITKGLTSSTILDLIEEYPNLEEITCCPSIFNRISKNYIDALNQLDITVSKKYNWGAKPKYSSLEEDILNLAKEGKKAKEIAGLLDISQNKVYYLLRKNKQGGKFDNYSKKHNHDEVKSLKEEGLKPKEIASKLDIPLRTVYYILNKNISCYNVMFRISRKEFNDFRIMYLNRLNKCQKSRVNVL